MLKKIALMLALITMSFVTYGNEFIKGADVSMLKQLEENGAKFYDENNKELECMTLLKNYGVNWIRIRTWVNPTDKNGKPLGGGNNDKNTTLILVKRAKDLGLKVLLDFHYSDFWADPSKQNKPKDWEGLTGKELEQKLYDYTKDMLISLKNINALPEMVQIGNELNGGMVWTDGKTWGEGAIGGYEGFANLLKAGIKATKDIDSNIKIMIHLADGGDNDLYKRVFDQLTEKKVDFDIIGLSFYPYWHGSFEGLQKNMDDISKRYGKDVIVAEISYAYTLADGDGFDNIFRANEETAGEFKATVKGQESVIRKVMNVVSNVPENRGKGFFYWEPDWIPVKGTGWKTGEGNGWDNQAMFDFKGKALSSLNVFKADPKEQVISTKIEAVNDTLVKTSLGEVPKMPAEVMVALDNGAIKKQKVKWENISDKKLKKANSFEISGVVEGTKIKAKATVIVSSQKNYITDAGFESGDIWKNSKWILDDSKSSLQIEKAAANVHEEKISLSYWKDSSFLFKISQKIVGLEKGKYRLRVWSMGDKGKKELYLFANNGVEEKKVAILDTTWSNWNRFEVSEIEVSNGTLLIGVSGNCASGDWGKIDEFELVKID